MGMFQRRWFQIFVSGLLLLYAIERVLRTTHNLNYVPSVIFLGSFLVPVTFVTYLYETLPNWGNAFSPMAVCFLGGGVVGTVVAGILEYDVLKTLGFLPLLGVALIEESAKLILPLGFYWLGRYRSQAAGILLGTACAMGFAALETMGYSFVALLQSKGNLSVLNGVLFARGLFSPAGHAAWTGLICAVVWREREKANHAIVNGPILRAFITAVGLHALWDIFNSLGGKTLMSFVSIEVLSLLVAVTSLNLLNQRIREAKSLLIR